LEINGEATEGISLTEAVSKIRGEKGTDVVLTLLGKEEKEAKEVTITRGRIKLESVEVEKKGNSVYYVRVSRFGERTFSEWQNAVERIVSERAKPKVILDLRNNPGGVLSTSVELASEFIDKGVIVSEKFATGRVQKFRSTREGKLTSAPVVVLVNEGSASASEILAAALSYHSNAELVGAPTFGKGTVQDARDLVDGSGIHITVAEWLTPSGENISEEGLDPDYEIEFTSEDAEEDRDPQLEKALELLE